MKKLRVTVNGVSYEVDVEVLEDEDDIGAGYGFPSSTSAPPAARVPTGGNAGGAAPAPAPAKAAAPTASPSTGDDKNVLTSPIAGVIVEVKVKAGDSVSENDSVVIIEAMKMNTNVSSPVSGKVKEVRVSSGDAVQQGQVLLTFE